MGVRFKHLLRVRKLSFTGIVITLMLLSVLLMSLYESINRLQSRSALLTSQKRCLPVHALGFLKIHKAASSAIQNMLFRYGYKHSLTFTLPESGNYLGREEPFHASMVNNKVSSIFSVHCKWNHEQVKQIVPEGAKFFTIIREPLELFESLYSYADFQGKTNLTIDEYAATQSVSGSRLQGFLGFNQMAWDLGAPLKQLANDTFIQGLIEEANKNFGLVLLADRMPESLILLKHFLCWPIEDMATFKINARKRKHKLSISNKTKKILEGKLKADYMIYDYFNRKFEDQVKAFGKKRMNREMAELRQVTNTLEDKCSLLKEDPTKLKGANKPISEKVIGFRSSAGKEQNIECRMLAWNELYTIRFLRQRQKSTQNII